MPIGGKRVYDRFGHSYNVTRILDSTGRRFDLRNYEAYSALYLPGPYAMVYLVAFALSTALLVHTILYHGGTIYNGIKHGKVEEDVHVKLMRAYPEVPDSWYASICLLSFAVAVVAVQVWPTDMPMWAVALSVLLPTLYLLPCGYLFATTGQPATINLLAQIIPGVLLNGRPLANMVRPPYCNRAVYSKMDRSQLTNPRIFFLISYPFAPSPDFQRIRYPDDCLSTPFYHGSQAGPLYQSPAQSIVHGSVCRYTLRWVLASRCERGPLCDCEGYMYGGPEEHAHVSAQSRVL